MCILLPQFKICEKISYDDNSQDVSIMRNNPIISRITTADFAYIETFVIQKAADDIIIITYGHSTIIDNIPAMIGTVMVLP